ncbi:hypothetical protein SHA53_004486, partial [Salmonella enterica]|nr:hypothetical protein [Salmonella enterica]
MLLTTVATKLCLHRKTRLTVATDILSGAHQTSASGPRYGRLYRRDRGPGNILAQERRQPCSIPGGTIRREVTKLKKVRD